jgi:hypothetical protein
MSAPLALPHITGGFDGDHSGQKQTIDRILQCAVALNWKSLAADEKIAMQVEYRTGPQQSLEYLKLWSSSARGFWNLVCEYWMVSSPAHQSGATFSGGNHSADLAWMLDAIMQHQGEFVAASTVFVDGLVQISSPTDTDIVAAQKDMTEALDRIGSLTARA